MVAARRSAPAWAWWAFVGGLAYQSVQLYLNVFHGGGGFFGNRLVIELVVLATPLVVVTYAEWSWEAAWRRLAAGGLAAYGVAVHATGAFLAWSLIGTGPGTDWTRYYPLVVVQHAGVTGWLVAGTAMACVFVYLAHRVQLERESRRAGGTARNTTPVRANAALPVSRSRCCRPKGCRPSGEGSEHVPCLASAVAPSDERAP
jgi:hypothetical protein